MKNMFAALAVVDAHERARQRAREASSAPVIGFAPASEAEIEEELAPRALRPFRPDGRVLQSPFHEISHEQWTAFAFALKTAHPSAVSDSNALGMFEMRYKRLADLGRVKNIRHERGPGRGNRPIAEWVSPRSLEEFLASPDEQLRVFIASVSKYLADIGSGKIKKPVGMSLSGALAILHRGGPSALAKWGEMQFERTREIFDLANGVF